MRHRYTERAGGTPPRPAYRGAKQRTAAQSADTGLSGDSSSPPDTNSPAYRHRGRLSRDAGKMRCSRAGYGKGKCVHQHIEIAVRDDGMAVKSCQAAMSCRRKARIRKNVRKGVLGPAIMRSWKESPAAVCIRALNAGSHRASDANVLKLLPSSEAAPLRSYSSGWHSVVTPFQVSDTQ